MVSDNTSTATLLMANKGAELVLRP
ncbi:uncharacterized protein METZ01_LOCUS83473 [marine metagenome]|uniref:Uncharacterized protein n=1 Tax=marine metagenome TaxID=408172 RepID=A0A381UR25_9ZZZZ